MKKTTLLLVLLLSFTLTNFSNAQEPMLGEVRIFAGNFAPRGWAFCEGQLIAISQNPALFSLVGTTYGGDGRTTFGLPDLKGRVPAGVGRGAGLQNISWGQRGGFDFPILSSNQMPQHKHAAVISGSSSLALSTTTAVNEIPEAGDVPAAARFGNGLGATKVKTYGPPTKLVSGGPINSSLQSVTIQQAGASQSFDNRQPYLGVRYIIALQGYFPPRS